MAAKQRNRLPTQKMHTITTGTVLRMEEPASERGKQKPNPAVVLVHEINPVEGFVGFLREHAVVGLAIGFVVGLQAQELVKLLVSSFINPAFQLFFGEKLSQKTFAISWHDRAPVTFGWGGFAYGLLNFLFVLAASYFIVIFFILDKLDKTKVEEVDEK